MKKVLLKSILVLGASSALVACGGDDSDSSGDTGTFSLNVTDAPALDFTKFVVPFNGVVLQPANGESITFTFDEARELDLLQLQGGVSAPLLEGVEVPAGEYEWIRLVLDEENIFAYDSNGAQNKVYVPSGGQTGLKLVSGFAVAQGGGNSFTIDFDVRKSVVNPESSGSGAEYFLKPALRLVDNLEVGSVSGTAPYDTINQDSGLVACTYEGSAYIFEGADATVSDLNVNIDGGPLTTAPVSLNDSGLYSYKIGFLQEGSYTVAYSCQSDDNEVTDNLEFIGTQNVTISAGEETTADIAAP